MYHIIKYRFVGSPDIHEIEKKTLNDVKAWKKEQESAGNKFAQFHVFRRINNLVNGKILYNQ
jgi:hypothetical protein